MMLGCTYSSWSRSGRRWSRGLSTFFAIHHSNGVWEELPQGLEERVREAFRQKLGVENVGNVTHYGHHIEIEIAPGSSRRLRDEAMALINHPLH